MVKNCAFVFLKPHAVTDKTKELVVQRFKDKGLEILKEGELKGEDIDKNKLIDSHYYAIASKATLQKPSQLNIPKDKFKEFFNEDWNTVVKDKVFNALDACAKLGLTADELDKEWAKAKANKKLVKFGGGFYCGLIETVSGKDPIYVMNGFFMSMRSKFVEPGCIVYYYVVEWDQSDLCWADFRGKVLGPTDPKDAPADSLRGEIYRDWKKLGQAFQPNVGDNAVHASASPFEALAERMNWLNYRPMRDAFGKQLLKVATKEQLNQWVKDPQVTYGAHPIKKSLYDSLEDTDTDYCLALCQMIALGVPPSKAEQDKINNLKNENEKLRDQLEKLKNLSRAIKDLVQFDFAEFRNLAGKPPKGGKGDQKNVKKDGKGGEKAKQEEKGGGGGGRSRGGRSRGGRGNRSRRGGGRR